MADSTRTIIDIGTNEQRDLGLADLGGSVYAEKVHLVNTADIGGGNAAAAFGVNDMENGATYLYVGLTDSSATWYMKRVAVDGSGVAHATIANNVGVASYAAAWAARASLTYGRFDEAF